MQNENKSTDPLSKIKQLDKDHRSIIKTNREALFSFKSLTIKDASIESINNCNPINFFSNIESLNFSSNQISNLTDLIQYFNNLRELNLSHN